MQQQLEQLEKDVGIEWQEFEIGELFGSAKRGIRLKSADRINGNLPFVTAGENNMGISAWIGNDVHIFPRNTITIDMFGSAKYRNYEYGADDHVAVVHTQNLPKSAVIFITTAIHKASNAGQFDYSRNFYASDAEGLKIQLPTLNNQIAFDFMEKFIATLDAERLATLDAYLCTTGLQDYKLTSDEQEALDGLGNQKWQTFKIGDILTWQTGISELDPLSIKSLMVSNDKKYPFYGQATINNGIIDYYELKEDVLNNKLSLPTILIHSNNQNIVYLDTPFYLKDGHGATSVLQSENLNKFSAQFLMGTIGKVISQKYSYNAKATKIELKNTVINLPVDEHNLLDYAYMELVIKAMQKVVIKNVVDYLQQRIDATKQVIH